MATSPHSIVAFVGMSGVGKSEAVRLFASLGDFEQIYFGGLVLEEVKRRGLPVGEETEGAVSRELREAHGMAAMAVLSTPKIDAAREASRAVLIDGLYSYSELTHLKGRYGDALALVAVHARKALRVARLGARPVRPLTPAEVDERDRREIETIEKGGPIAIADYHIVNDAGLAELETAIRDIHAAITHR